MANHPKNSLMRRKDNKLMAIRQTASAGKIETPSQRNWRPSIEDWKLIQELRAKLGVTEPDIIRMGIRKLAEAEGLR